MITQYDPTQPPLELKSDLAGELPLYLYWPQDKSILLYSKSITKLLNDTRVLKPLKISTEGLSFLLQSGVVPPPKTAYQDIYILGIGDKAKVVTLNHKIDIQFFNEFEFSNTNRLHADELQPDENLILQMLAEATISRIDQSKPSFLFHSAGKDSNSIALALAEAGWQDRVTLITHKSKGLADESGISAKVAKQLGFRHQILHEIDLLKPQHKFAINDYFVNAPFPCTDNVSLAYPLYAYQLPELKGANIIDGMGNDVYIGHVPSVREYRLQRLSSYLRNFRYLSKYLSTDSLFQPAGRSRAECTGLWGLSFSDSVKLLNNQYDVFNFWLKKDIGQDYLELRASVRGVIIDQEIFTRKVRNFADSIGSTLVLPWADARIANYFNKMPEEHLFDRSNFINKIILRKILNKKIGLDSDLLGKMVFSYDVHGVVQNNLDYFINEIKKSLLWNSQNSEKLLIKYASLINAPTRVGSISRNVIYRLYLITMWYNHCKYI